MEENKMHEDARSDTNDHDSSNNLSIGKSLLKNFVKKEKSNKLN